MFTQIRRINVNKMTMSIRRMSNNSNNDINFDIIISELKSIKNILSTTMMFIVPAVGCYVGSEIGKVLVKFK